jgi:branched-subunit amino acid aminotransferase/4-amino-4-deoxychorismate lyase
MPDNLPAVERKISTVLAIRPECFITHPAELAVLRGMTPDQLENFAIDHGWRVVSRLGGRQIEFYNDAAARLAREQEI